MRFRKSIKLFPGVKINVSGSGISTSVGPKGATVNIKPGRKTRLTTGLPGTGLSHTQNLTDSPPDAPKLGSGSGTVLLFLIIIFGFAYCSVH